MRGIFRVDVSCHSYVDDTARGDGWRKEDGGEFNLVCLMISLRLSETQGLCEL